MVRGFFPQGSNNSVTTNTNFPPQSGGENTLPTVQNETFDNVPDGTGNVTFDNVPDGTGIITVVES